VIDEEMLKRMRESYRRLAFPKGGAYNLRSRDKQNNALIARGGFYACQALIQIISRAKVEQHISETRKTNRKR
jgi:hypothetical protein